MHGFGGGGALGDAPGHEFPGEVRAERREPTLGGVGDVAGQVEDGVDLFVAEVDLQSCAVALGPVHAG